ncbi:MAG TPA: GNAT family N-acetyltransferase [Candidatus Angelobacter sp.]|nr:GNAT family N-acetyltransferase [Candidatus Angelobacter sp.]
MISATGETKLPGAALSTQVQTGGAELLAELAPAWSALCDEAKDEVFYRPEWARSYLDAFAPAAALTIISVRDGPRLCALLPLLRERIWITGLPAMALTLPANVHSARAGFPIAAGAERDQILRALWQSLKELTGWRLLDVSHVLEGSPFDQLLALARAEDFPVARKRTSQTLYLPIAAAADFNSAANPNAQPPWMAETRPKFRSHLRRARRQLEEQGALSLKHFSTADPAALTRFYDLEASGWKGAEGTAIKCDPRTLAFYNSVAVAAAVHGYLSLDFLELNSKPIAAHFAFNFRGRYLLAKAAYDESFRRFGPGQLLVHSVLSETSGRGLVEFDFVGPATWDESRWASHRRTSYRVFVFRKNLYGRLLYAARISARNAARRLLGRQQEDESKPLELKSKPQGAEDADAANKTGDA